MMKRALLSLLAPLSWLFGAAVWVRSRLFDLGWLPQTRFDLPVIGIGNLAVGGTGKTPHVEFVLRLLHAKGYRVAMLSRGYGRRTRGFVMASAAARADEVGDEPLQVARNCPFARVAVCEDRVKGIKMLRRACPEVEVVVLDDAYQHRYVQPGLQVLLTDAARLYTHDHLLPWGRLREPASAARRADLIVVTKCSPGQKPALPLLPHQQLFHSRIGYGQPYAYAPQAAQAVDMPVAEHVLLLTGIANPAPLKAHVAQGGQVSIEELHFPDHHRFSAADAATINARYEALAAKGCAVVLTTQKDAARLAGIEAHLLPALLAHLYVQPIAVDISPNEIFTQHIINYVQQNQRNRGMD